MNSGSWTTQLSGWGERGENHGSAECSRGPEVVPDPSRELVLSLDGKWQRWSTSWTGSFRFCVIRYAP